MFSRSHVPAGHPLGRLSLRWRPWLAKVAAACLLVATADWLFMEPYKAYQDQTAYEVVTDEAGAIIGLFGLLTVAMIALVRPDVRGDRRVLAALAAAVLLCLAIVNEPSLLAVTLLWAALVLASVLPRAARFGHAWQWGRRIILAPSFALWSVGLDVRQLLHARMRRRMASISTLALGMAVPIGGTVIFLWLFAEANPLFERVLARLDVDDALQWFTGWRLFLWLVVGIAAWGLLRPRTLRPRSGAVITEAPLPGWHAALLSPQSLLSALLAFNLLFAVQNALDLVFLFEGAALPEGMTFADYAHRGAYPLIVTALLAAVFVLVALRPGAGAAVHLLVYAWLAQNVLLIIFSVVRTVDYVEAYSLTLWRLSALIWMGLVAFGLVSIAARIRLGRSGAWLINLNAGVAAALLVTVSFVDLRGMVANYNVGRYLAGEGPKIDLYYLERLGPATLPALMRLPGVALDEYRYRERARMIDELAGQQADWRRWTFLGARVQAGLPTSVSRY